MDERTQARFEARAGVIKAMARPTRLFIADELSRGERCVCEIAEMIAWGARNDRARVCFPCLCWPRR